MMDHARCHSGSNSPEPPGLLETNPTDTESVMNGMYKSILPALLVSSFASPAVAAGEIEEVIVKARLLSGAEALINERRDNDVVTDIIGAEFISRVGDTTIAGVLRRMPGLSLVSDKFVYVRGLGERYSSSSLNKATIPSPDLTRNVIPLDLFPTAIVESLAVQKTYSADRPASFGGGSIDIRTKGIPDTLAYSLELTGGHNTETDNSIYSYRSGGDDKFGTDDGTRALSGEISKQIVRFQGSLDAQNILNTLRHEGNVTATFAEAQEINRAMALGLNRDISISQENPDPDWTIRGSIGNNYLLNDDWEAGFLAGGAYATQWRKTEALAQDFTFPEERFERESETTRSVDINGNLNFGIRYGDDHEITTTTLYIRNTDDEVAIIDFFNENREKSDGLGFQNRRIKYEEREMVVKQVMGTHLLGESTRRLVPLLPLTWIPEDLQFDWYYSVSRAMTEIPNEVVVSLETTTDPVSGSVQSASVVLDSAAADYRFTSLDDEVVNYAGKVTWPIEAAASMILLSAGWEHTQKIRTYQQTQFSLGALFVNGIEVLQGPLTGVFSDSNITDASNNFVFDLTGTNNQSYIAVTMTDAVYANIDWTWQDNWRISAGARWEDYKQLALDWDIYAFDVARPQVTVDPEALQKALFKDDKVYPAISLTYMTEWWADVFQLRFGYSETVVRPDLREITDASYIDARTGFLTDGNPSIRPADLTNYDLRAEWFFDNGDNLTLSLYYKDIGNPIEFFESAASDTNRSREIINADSAEIYGFEIEGLKHLGTYGMFWEPFFIQGNLTIQDSELVAGELADAPTNQVRALAGASEYVANLLVGFDSTSGKHSATLSYNVFGERLFTAGRRGAPDSYETPFHSLDITYNWYPADSITLKLKLQNILGEAIEIERQGVIAFREKPGTGVSLAFRWAF